nr:PREDICTED: uncharacterized protein LOC109040393 [Bemisia tabaci]
MVQDPRSFFGSNSCFPQLRFCCCGCSLRTGVLIIGWYTVVIGVFSMMGSLPVVKGLNDRFLTTESPERKLAIFVWAMDFIIDGILLRVAAAILLFGVYSSKPRCVLLYLIVAVVSAAKLGIEIPLVALTNIGKVKVQFSFLDVFVPLLQHPIALFFTFMLTLYFIMVTNSYYTEMESAPPRNKCGTGDSEDRTRNA